jgi:hypothetical protein
VRAGCEKRRTIHWPRIPVNPDFGDSVGTAGPTDGARWTEKRMDPDLAAFEIRQHCDSQRTKPNFDMPGATALIAGTLPF